MLRILHPELRPLDLAPSRRELDLSVAADRFTSGDMKAGDHLLADLRSSDDPLTKAEAILVHRYVEWHQRYAFAGDVAPLDGDGRVRILAARVSGDVDEAALAEISPSLSVEDTESLQNARQAIDADLACFDAVLFASLVSHVPIASTVPSDLFAKATADARTRSDDATEYCRVASERLAHIGTPEATLRSRYLDALVRRAQNRDIEADLTRISTEALANRPCLSAAALMLAGDTLIAPGGYVESLGYDLAVEPGRSMGPSGKIPTAFVAAFAGSPVLEHIRALYSRAATNAEDGKCAFQRVARSLRQAYLEFTVAPSPSSATSFEATAALSRALHNPRAEALATAYAGLARATTGPLLAAIAERSRAGDDGGALTLAGVGMTAAVQTWVMNPSTDNARLVLTALSYIGDDLRSQKRYASAIAADHARSFVLILVGRSGFPSETDLQILNSKQIVADCEALLADLESRPEGRAEGDSSGKDPYDRAGYRSMLRTALIGLQRTFGELGREEQRNDLLAASKYYGDRAAEIAGVPLTEEIMRRHADIRASLDAEDQRLLKMLSPSCSKLPRLRKRMSARQTPSDRADAIVGALVRHACSKGINSNLATSIDEFDFSRWARQELLGVLSSQDEKTLLFRPPIYDRIAVMFEAALIANRGETALKWCDVIASLSGSDSDNAKTMSLFWRGRVLLALKRTKEALESANSLVSLPGIKQSGYSPAWDEDITLLLRAHVQAGNVREAFMVGEQLEESRHYKQLMMPTAVLQGSSESAELAALNEKEIQRPLSPANEKRKYELSAAIRESQVTSYFGVTHSISEVEAALDGRTTVIAYRVTPDGIVGWRIEADRPPMMKLLPGDTETLLRRARDMSYYSGMGMLAEAMQAAGEVFQALIAPMGDLGAERRIVFLLDPAIGNVPLEMAMMSNSRMLAEDHSVIYANFYWDRTAVDKSRKGGVAVGFNGLLTEAENEARDVAGLMKTLPIVGSDAKVSTAIEAARHSRRIHIAAHTIEDSDNPYLSSLSLADGNVEAWQLFKAAMAAELIVLSACQTRGSYSVEDGGEISMASLAHTAGVKWVIASRWVVNDTQSRALMNTFYQELAYDDDIPAAFQRARAKMLSGSAIERLTALSFGVSLRSISDLKIGAKASSKAAEQGLHGTDPVKKPSPDPTAHPL